MRRRDALKTLGIGALTATAGCLGGFERQSAWRDPPLVENRPDAVYLPAITEGMKMYGMTTIGPYGVALSYSYPHRFWSVAGPELQKTVVEADDSVHLMASVWDHETGTVLPFDAGVTIEILRDGSLVSEEVAYPMLSQQMGMHYGSNYVLDGEGDYEARVTVGGTSLHRTGSFAGQFETVETATFEFTFETDELYDVELERLGDEAGTLGAVPAMEMMNVPTGALPAIDALPGDHLGRQTSGDAHFDAFVVDDGSPFDADGAYLYVSARTPYNEFVLPMMGVRGTVERDGTPVLDGERLRRTLDPELGYHYGVAVDSLESDDTVTLAVDVPPQVARHDGYETAFLSFDSMQFEL
ncbi:MULTISPECIES: iron transporter [Haloferax]|uniref:Iron transporter n=2 Tax=Haloferax TaxID=2251 RepID=A0A6G1Z6X5_9EURY|nr:MULTISPECIES: iron transporter [Haloferax]KAB1185066.1 iron transporter [Haloferax sp. CBA1149]MRW82243.1 iron transporter [Haloferax marinisediminis]